MKKDVAAERIVISGLLQFGEDLWYEINGFLKEQHFQINENRFLYTAISKLIFEEKIAKPQISSVLAVLDKMSNKFEISIENYLEACSNHLTTIPEATLMAKKVIKVSILNNLIYRAGTTGDKLSKMTGDEPLQQILAAAEGDITEFTDSILDVKETVAVGATLNEFLERLRDSAGKPRGIQTGFKLWDEAIGGGMRGPGFHVMGARAKQGKSMISVQIGSNVAKQGVPVLYCDTELSQDITNARLLANVSGITINEIESGTFGQNQYKNGKIVAAAELIEQMPLFYNNISGQPHAQWIAAMRRWIHKSVGFKPDGTAKDCLIILDYLKMMDLKEMGQNKEYQYLGQIATDLHNFCIQYNIPMLVLVQLNREGINGSGQGVIADSDRIMRLCSSFTIFRPKDEIDLADDPEGNRKLEVVDCRFGPGLDSGTYINLMCDYGKCSIKEGRKNKASKPKTVQSNNSQGSSQPKSGSDSEAPFDSDDSLET